MGEGSSLGILNEYVCQEWRNLTAAELRKYVVMGRDVQVQESIGSH
jgi:hypothetical protein